MILPKFHNVWSTGGDIVANEKCTANWWLFQIWANRKHGTLSRCNLKHKNTVTLYEKGKHLYSEKNQI